ncbi:MAG: mandelate racemase/muconate lactonizing enzyme family protein [Litorilinea sp.]
MTNEIVKLTTIETFHQDARVALVRVRTADGAEGWGQTAPAQADITAQVLHRQVAPLVLGKPTIDLSDLDGLAAEVIEQTYKFPGTYVCRALTGVETALWDLRGKLAEKSVCELLGGAPRPFPVYGSSMRRDTTPQEEVERLQRQQEAHGFRAFKLKIGKRAGHDADEWPGRTPQLVAAVRAALGSATELLVDANSCYTPMRAIEMGKLLEDHGYAHFEEPCPYWELEWTAQVARALDIPVAGGEQDFDLHQWRRMFALGSVDIAQPDVCYVGGVARTLRVAKMAQAHNLPCVPHSANHSLVLIFTLHLMGALPNAGQHVEYSIEPQAWAHTFYDPLPVVQDGHVAIPAGPGWGITIRPDWLEKATRQVSEADTE